MRTLAAAALAAALPITASAADLAGPWIVKADLGPQLRVTLLCVWKADGQALSGPCYPASGRVMNAAGSLNARKLIFKYSTTYNGSGLQLEYRGTLQADGSVSGPVANRLSSGTFTGQPGFQPSDQLQAWSFQVAFPEIPAFALVCAFPKAGPKIAGPCVIPAGDSVAATGTSDGVKIAFDYDTAYQNQPVHAHYEGSVQGATLAGTVKAGSSAGSFTAKRP